MGIADNIRKLKSELPSTVELVAVSKFKPVEDILAAYEAGQRAFGENRPQELAAKGPQLPADIVWHFIGHLQTNKVKMVVPYAHLIHSVDSERLLAEIDKAACAAGKVMDCLLEIHIEIVVGQDGATHRGNTDGLVLNAHLLNHFGDNAVGSAMSAAGAKCKPCIFF